MVKEKSWRIWIEKVSFEPNTIKSVVIIGKWKKIEELGINLVQYASLVEKNNFGYNLSHDVARLERI